MAFIVSPDPYDNVVSMPLEQEGFSASPEYRQLVGNGEDLPGVVACAYVRYLSRLLKSGRGDLRYLLKPLNALSRLHDMRINELLLDEVIEQFEADNIWEAVKAELDDTFVNLAENRRFDL